MTPQQFLYLAESLHAAETFGRFAVWNAKEGHEASARNAAYAAAHALHRAHLIAGVRYDVDAPARTSVTAVTYPWEKGSTPLPLCENSGGENAAKNAQPVE